MSYKKLFKLASMFSKKYAQEYKPTPAEYSSDGSYERILRKEKIRDIVNYFDGFRGLEPDKLEKVTNQIIELVDEGWLKEEILEYINLMEEVNPDLDEETGFMLMDRLLKKVERRLNPEEESD